jgi:DNA-binding transcriptional regulator LsrR (DeoR family)
MGDEDATAQRFAEVLKLAFVDGPGVRAIARPPHVARKTVRRILARERRKRVAGPAAPRPTLLAAYEGAIR